MKFLELYEDEECYAETKMKSWKAINRIVKSLMIKRILLQLYIKVQVKYFNH